MTAAELIRGLEAVGGRVCLRGERLVMAAPPGAASPELIERLRAAKPALIAYLRGHCWHCGETEGPRGPLLAIGTTEDGHSWVHAYCYPAWLAARLDAPCRAPRRARSEG